MILTVIIRDENPVRYLNEPVRHRSVQVILTREQCDALLLRHDGEAISHAFIEPPEEART